MNPKIYTYFEKDPTLSGFDEVITAWESRWKTAGWDPVILDGSHARQHPKYDEVAAAVDAFPTVNPKQYETACWLRWLAIEAVGGGLMVDVDVLPVRFTKFTLPAVAETTCLDAQRCPCAVMVCGDTISNLILNHPHQFSLYNAQPHYSDMLMFMSTQIPTVDLCRELGNNGWESVPMVHLSSGALAKVGYSKATFSLAVEKMLSDEKRPKVCYIAGPMTGYIEFNFPAFFRAEEALIKMGYDVRNPARHDLEMGFNPATDTPTKEQIKAFIDWDTDQVINHADEVICLRGWERSTGAVAEIALAQWCRKPTLSWPSLTPVERVAK